MEKPNVVILGAGYGGMITAVNLQKSLGTNEAQITLVNKNEYHYQSTALHEGAAGTLHHDQIRIPIRDVINMNKVNFVQDTVVAIDPKEKKVSLEDGELTYDILVIGLGFEAATFGIPGLEEHAFMIGSINSSRLLRQHIEYNFAKYHNQVKKDPGLLNFVIGGAGFTGVEFAGELANRIPELCKEYDIDRSQVRLITVEGAPMIMPGFDEALIEYTRNSLEARGVEFITGAMLKECRADGIVYEKDEEQVEIPTRTTVWAAGVRANKVVEQSSFEHNRGKIEVTPDMRSPEYDDVFVVGDCALIWDKDSDRPYPPTAQIALQAAEVVAFNITALIQNNSLKPFEPDLKGTVASLGNNDAMGTILDDRKIYGWFATLMKKAIDNRYLFKLGGLRILLRYGKFNPFY